MELIKEIQINNKKSPSKGEKRIMAFITAICLLTPFAIIIPLLFSDPTLISYQERIMPDHSILAIKELSFGGFPFIAHSDGKIMVYSYNNKGISEGVIEYVHLGSDLMIRIYSNKQQILINKRKMLEYLRKEAPFLRRHLQANDLIVKKQRMASEFKQIMKETLASHFLEKGTVSIEEFNEVSSIYKEKTPNYSSEIPQFIPSLRHFAPSASQIEYIKHKLLIPNLKALLNYAPKVLRAAKIKTLATNLPIMNEESGQIIRRNKLIAHMVIEAIQSTRGQAVRTQKLRMQTIQRQMKQMVTDSLQMTNAEITAKRCSVKEMGIIVCRQRELSNTQSALPNLALSIPVNS